jgi:hypothetical protein
MARITDATDTWSTAVLLSNDEIWQARAGSVFLTTTATPDAEDGLLIVEGQAVRFSAGQQVAYRRVGPVNTTIVRETV